MSWDLNCGSSCMPAGMRENDLPEADEPDECLGCGERECCCHLDWDDEDEQILREGLADLANGPDIDELE